MFKNILYIKKLSLCLKSESDQKLFTNSPHPDVYFSEFIQIRPKVYFAHLKAELAITYLRYQGNSDVAGNSPKS